MPIPALRASVCQLRPESRGTLRIKSADPVGAAGPVAMISPPRPIMMVGALVLPDTDPA